MECAERTVAVSRAVKLRELVNVVKNRPANHTLIQRSRYSIDPLKPKRGDVRLESWIQLARSG